MTGLFSAAAALRLPFTPAAAFYPTLALGLALLAGCGGGDNAAGAEANSAAPLSAELAQRMTVQAVRGAPVSGVYALRSVHSALCLDIEGSATVNGASATQTSCNGTASQRFELRADVAGSYRFVNVNSGKALDVRDVSNANGALIQQWSVAGSDNQRFRLVASGEGFAIQAQHSGKCLDVQGWSRHAGSPIQQWDCTGNANQQWQFAAQDVPPTEPPTEPPPDPAPPHADLSDARKKDIAMQLVSSAENSSLNWRAQYGYVQDINDGRGYTAGIIGFCSGTGDMLELVIHYTRRAPNNGLAKYLGALRKLNGSASHAGLDPNFRADWRTAAADAVFQQAQDAERDTVYFNPAVQQARQDGLRALGQFIYYDAIVMHGPGEDGVSFGGIRKAALRSAKPPAQGGSETGYLNAFLDARVAAMRTEEAHSDVSRVDTAQRVFLKAGNLDLGTPLAWKVYGDSFAIK